MCHSPQDMAHQTPYEVYFFMASSTATATATPEPTALNPGNTPEPTDNGNYVLPTVAPQDIWQAEPGVESSPTPTPEPSAGASASPAPDATEEAVLPEDRWALEE